MTQPTTPLPLPTQVADQIAGHDFANALAAWVNYLAAQISVSLAAVVSYSGTLSVPNGPGSGTGAFAGGRTYASFDTVEYDPLGMFNTGISHGSQLLTLPQQGLYIPFGYGVAGANGTGFRTVAIDLSADAGLSVASIQIGNAGATVGTFLPVSMFKPIAGGNTLALRPDQNSGGALNFSNLKLAVARVALS